MNISKLTTLTLLPLTLALSAGCSHLKTSDPRSAAPAPMAAAPASTAAPAPVEAPAPTPVKTPKPPVWQDVTIRSIPSGATVVIDGQPVGTTPLSAKLELGTSYNLELLLPGYLISSQSVHAVSSNGGGISLGKAGLVAYHPVAFPGELRIFLSLDQNPLKALENAISTLDSQLERNKITPDAYQEKVAEVTRFYSQGK
jgi:hypothetical protein